MKNRSKVETMIANWMRKYFQSANKKPLGTITVETVVQGLLKEGYKEVGGSDVFRILRRIKDGQCIKVFYDNYDKPNYIIVRESVEGYEVGKEN